MTTAPVKVFAPRSCNFPVPLSVIFVGDAPSTIAELITKVPAPYWLKINSLPAPGCKLPPETVVVLAEVAPFKMPPVLIVLTPVKVSVKAVAKFKRRLLTVIPALKVGLVVTSTSEVVR